MGSVYRKTFTKALPASAEVFVRYGERLARWKDNKGKTRTAKLTKSIDGADRVVIEAKTYTAKHRTGAGLVVETSTGCRDETAARRVLGELERLGELVKSGVLTAAEDAIADHQPTLLEQHFDAYRKHLEFERTTGKYRGETLARLRRIAEECGFIRLADLDQQSLESWLLELTRPKQQGDKAIPGVSARTQNAYRESAVAFGNWCVETSRLTSNPFAKIKKADQETDPRRQRRSMTETELIQLLDVARRRPLLETMTVRRGKRKGEVIAQLRPETVARLELLGRERALIYKTLVLTGLRLDAADEKNREGNSLPIRRDLATDLKDWVNLKRERLCGAATVASNGQIAGVIPMAASAPIKLPADTLLFTVPQGLVRILDRDLKLAGIAKRDERGRTLDVHALRHTFGTLLSKGGVAPRTAQAAMRHSTIDLTMNVYTDPKLLDVHGALDSLPALPLNTERQSMREVAKATGTDDLPTSPLAPVLAPNPDFPCKSESFTVKSTGEREAGKGSRSLSATSSPVKQNNPLTIAVNGLRQSGRQDLNLRPSGPKPDALAKLSYAPDVSQISLGRGTFNVNGGIAAGESEVHHRVSVMNFQFSGGWTFVHTHDYTIEPILKMMSRFGQHATSR